MAVHTKGFFLTLLEPRFKGQALHEQRRVGRLPAARAGPLAGCVDTAACTWSALAAPATFPPPWSMSGTEQAIRALSRVPVLPAGPLPKPLHLSGCALSQFSRRAPSSTCKVHNSHAPPPPRSEQAGSFYHLSKVHDSHNMHFAARAWKLPITDLNQVGPLEEGLGRWGAAPGQNEILFFCGWAVGSGCWAPPRRSAQRSNVRHASPALRASVARGRLQDGCRAWRRAAAVVASSVSSPSSRAIALHPTHTPHTHTPAPTPPSTPTPTHTGRGVRRAH